MVEEEGELNYEAVEVCFASKYVAKMVFKHLTATSSVELCFLIKELPSSDLRETFLENVAHAKIPAGGKFKVRCLQLKPN